MFFVLGATEMWFPNLHACQNCIRIGQVVLYLQLTPESQGLNTIELYFSPTQVHRGPYVSRTTVLLAQNDKPGCLDLEASLSSLEAFFSCSRGSEGVLKWQLGSMASKRHMSHPFICPNPTVPPNCKSSAFPFCWEESRIRTGKH